MTVPRLRRLATKEPPYNDHGKRPWIERGVWPCFWVSHPDADKGIRVQVFRRRITVRQATVIRFHLAADERYDLYLNGRLVGRGSERGTPDKWFFDTYEARLPKGTSVIVVRVWALGGVGPRAQMSVSPGLLCSPEKEEHRRLIGTGVARWEVRLLKGYGFSVPFAHPYFSIGHNVDVRGEGSDWRSGGGTGWETARRMHPGSDAVLRTRVSASEQLLAPSFLPPMRHTLWTKGLVRHADRLGGTGLPILSENSDVSLVRLGEQLWKEGKVVTIPARTKVRFLIDFRDYVCGYTRIVAAGGKGGSVRLHWAESLFEETGGQENFATAVALEASEKRKGNRDEVEGKFFAGVGETFHPEGGTEVYDGPFWRAGRYLKVTVVTADQAMKLKRLEIESTCYPLRVEGRVETGDRDLSRLVKRALRTVQVSCHDAWIDPYYEQMMWAGDGIQHMMVNMCLGRDVRLSVKWLETLFAARLPSGFRCARYPARDRLLIPSYSLFLVQGLKEYAWWRDDEPTVRRLLPAAREVIQTFERYLTQDDVLGLLPGWNFVDWIEGWKSGVPPGAEQGSCGIVCWQFIYCLVQMAELEKALGEKELAGRHLRVARRCAQGAIRKFWSEERGLFADDSAHRNFSEHGQCFPLLSGLLQPDMRKRMIAGLAGTDLTRATMSFSHYLFQALGQAGRTDMIHDRLAPWFALDEIGLLTVPEKPEPSRSDCHAWSAHPYYHLMATFAGLRPASPGFRSIILAPCLGPLKKIKVDMPHPEGMLRVYLERTENGVDGSLTLPSGEKLPIKRSGILHAL